MYSATTVNAIDGVTENEESSVSRDQESYIEDGSISKMARRFWPSAPSLKRADCHQ